MHKTEQFFLTSGKVPGDLAAARNDAHFSTILLFFVSILAGHDHAGARSPNTRTGEAQARPGGASSACFVAWLREGETGKEKKPPLSLHLSQPLRPFPCPCHARTDCMPIESRKGSAVTFLRWPGAIILKKWVRIRTFAHTRERKHLMAGERSHHLRAKPVGHAGSAKREDGKVGKPES
jgi:hypothetical protein